MTYSPELAETFQRAACEAAREGLCHRARCGSVIVNGGRVIGSGANMPPNRKCLDVCFKDTLPSTFKSDRTCCMHAEQNAIMDALRNHPTEVAGATLYFARIDADGNEVPSGDPYCTICSKMSQAAGISLFVLRHADGFTAYESARYNELSFGR